MKNRHLVIRSTEPVRGAKEPDSDTHHDDRCGDLLDRKKTIVVEFDALPPSVFVIIHDINADGVSNNIAPEDAHCCKGMDKFKPALSHPDNVYRCRSQRKDNRSVFFPENTFCQKSLINLNSVNEAADD